MQTAVTLPGPLTLPIRRIIETREASLLGHCAAPPAMRSVTLRPPAPLSQSALLANWISTRDREWPAIYPKARYSSITLRVSATDNAPRLFSRCDHDRDGRTRRAAQPQCVAGNTGAHQCQRTG